MMNRNEFMRQYSDESFQLVVRIVGCWNKGQDAFPKMGNLYHAQARFDRAIDMRSNLIIDQRPFSKLEWLTPKHFFGHPYGFAFKEGHLYRVLVRPALANEESRPRGPHTENSYYVEKVLESDVDEPRLEPYLEFASGFHPEEVQLDFVVERGPSGWADVFGYRRTGVRYLAIAQGEHDDPIPCAGRLWIMEKARGSGMETNFTELGAYRLVVRKSKEDPKIFLLVRVVEELHEERFETFRQEYMKPVVIHSPLGDFTLDRDCDWFEGRVDYLGKPCSVLLMVEEGSTDASIGLARLEALCADLPSVDRAARNYAADELLETACDWCEEDLTREQFMERMEYPSIRVGDDGSVDIMFDDGGMFMGHVIVVSMATDGSFESADIEG